MTEPTGSGKDASASEPDWMKGSETIMLAEDREEVRDLVTAILESHGYEVISAANGRAALEIVESLGRPIHLLVTDVVMPEMKGPELSKRLRELHPTLPVLFMSGYDEPSDILRTIDGGYAFLKKPFSAPDLVREVRRLLERVV